MTQPPGGLPGRPDTEPVPLPEPATADEHAPAAAAEIDFIDAAPADGPPYPPIGAFPDEQPDSDPTERLVPIADEQTEYRASPDQTQLLRPVAEQSTAWQPPDQPWHAQHEKSGEWQHQPPDHLAREHSPPYGTHDPTQLVTGPPPPPWQVQPAPAADDRRRKTGLWVSVALTTTLLLCGGGAFSAYLLLKEADGGGAPDPATAVDQFMTAIYTRQDAAAADDLVCREARDKDRLAARVNQIKGYADLYEGPSFTWDDPAVSGQSEDRATVSVRLTMSTEDEKTAQQKLTFTTVRKTGWLVCEIAG